MSSPDDIAPRRAEDEALEWLVDFESLSGDEERRFFAWLDESPAHRAAFEKVERDWRRLDVVSRLAAGEPDPDVAGRWLRRRRRRRLYLPAAAAAIVAAVAIALTFSRTPNFDAGYHTGIGEHREIRLPDDSVVELNTKSELSVHYSRDKRRVVLLRGEAHFDVAHAPERPFNVLAGAGSVRAVGTAFNVYLKGDLVEVTVTKGVIEVRPNAAPAAAAEAPQDGAPAAPPPKTVKEGERIEYGDTVEAVSRFDPAKVARRLAWQDGMLDFQGETLAEVIAEASRYTSTRITIEDPEIEGLHVTGYFRAGDVDTLLKLIESNERVSVQRVHPGLVRLTARRD